MIVNSYNIEFGYELLSAVPYAYELHQKGLLTKTISGIGSEPLYYFSPKHEINPESRNWYNTDKARLGGLPYTFIHKPEQPDKIFPPYKEHFQNEEFKFEKPSLCICNRMNIEWGFKAINYFDEEILDWLFENLKAKFEIIYFPVALPEYLQDGVAPLRLNDEEIARKHGVKLFTELLNGRGWNDVLLRVFANCERFITMNGGYSILSSLFSGTNIIFSIPGAVQTRELKSGSFWRWYSNHNNQRVLHVPSKEELKQKVSAIYLDELPCVNLLIRTHRENYLAGCMETVLAQNYPNLNVILICDSEKSVQFTRGYPARMVRVQKKLQGEERPAGDDYGIYFPFNEYLGEVQKLVSGFIMFLDDDDVFNYSFSVDHIVKSLEPDKLTVWKTDFKDGRILPNESFGNEIKLYDVTGIGIAYHSSQIDKTDWSCWKRADFRTARNLGNELSINWVDEVLTSIQDRPGNGTKKDIIKREKIQSVKLTFPDGKSYVQMFSESELETCKNYFKNYQVCIELMN